MLRLLSGSGWHRANMASDSAVSIAGVTPTPLSVFVLCSTWAHDRRQFLPGGAAVVTAGDSWRRSLATGWLSGGVTSPPSLGRDRLPVMPLVLAGGAGFSRSRDRRRIPPRRRCSRVVFPAAIAPLIRRRLALRRRYVIPGPGPHWLPAVSAAVV